MFYESGRDLSRYYSYNDNVCSSHFHKSVELLYNIEKPKQVIINGEEITLNKNELLVVFPYEVHAYKQSGANNICITIPPSLCREFLSAVNGKTPSRRVFNDSDLLSDILKHIQLLKENVSKITLIGITNYVLGRILDNVTLIDDTPYNEKIITDILKFIDENYNKNLTLDDLAKEFGYSKYYFSNLFNSKIKSSLPKFLNSVRINKSLELLRSNKITDVAYMVGFNSPQQFYLNFKKVLNVTPKQYLKNN